MTRTPSAGVTMASPDWRKTDARRLAFLDALVARKRVLYVGEPHHLVAEKYDFRLLVLKRLAPRGWTRLGMEMGRSDARRVDLYLETGDEAWLERASLYADGWAPFRKAEFEFWRSLRSISEKRRGDAPRVRVFGFDLDMFPGSGYEDVRAALSGRGAAGRSAKALSMVEGLPGSASAAGQCARLRRILAYVRAHRTALGSEIGVRAADEVRLALLNLRESYRFSACGSSDDDWLESLKLREETMRREVDHALASERGPVILMGHVMHLSKDSSRVREGPVGSKAPFAPPSLGDHLRRTRTGQVRSAWMLYGRLLGKRRGAAPAKGPALPASGEASFFRIDEPGSRPAGLEKPVDIRVNGELDDPLNEAVVSAVLPEQADAVFYVPNATPIR